MFNLQLLRNLSRVHNDSLDAIDIVVGAMLETKDGNPGGLFRQIILNQFRRIRDGDRFWFENTENRLVLTRKLLLFLVFLLLFNCLGFSVKKKLKKFEEQQSEMLF